MEMAEALGSSSSWPSPPGSLVSLMGDEGSAVPEMIEIELYRRLVERTVGRRVVEVLAPDDWFLKGVTAGELQAALTGQDPKGRDWLVEHAGTLQLIEANWKLIPPNFASGKAAPMSSLPTRSWRLRRVNSSRSTAGS